jgi:crotonobetainyl-CoA:carnitine CoA-transferase CaiB-like acyl-CoA transferase
LWRLIEGADVLVENFSPGTLERLGFGYETVKVRRPEIVYAAISGFGQSGPDFRRTAYDLIVQGTSGMMSITGHPGGPPTRLGVPIADIGGGMFAAYAIVAALFDRERSGEGSYVDISMLGGQVALLSYQAGLYLSTGTTPGQLGNAHPMIAPYDTFRTADGYVNLAVGNDSLWARFCAALDLEPLLEDERFVNNAGRSTNRSALYAVIEPKLAALTTDEVVRRLDTAGVPCGPIRDVAQAMDDSQTRAQDLVLDVEHPTLGRLEVAGAPYHFDGEPVRARHAPPLLGQQTAEILAEIGYSSEEIAALIDSGAAQSA